MSEFSQDVEMMIDVPSIDDMDGGDGEENYEQGNMLNNMNNNMQDEERLDTLGSSRRSSVHSQASHNSNNVKQGGGQNIKNNNDIELKRKRQMAPPTRTACCGAGDEGSCSIFWKPAKTRDSGKRYKAQCKIKSPIIEDECL